MPDKPHTGPSMAIAKSVVLLLALICIYILYDQTGFQLNIKSPVEALKKAAQVGSEDSGSGQSAAVGDTGSAQEEVSLQGGQDLGFTMSASFDDSSLYKVVPAEYSASSSLSGSFGTYGPGNLFDEDVTTCWQDGVEGNGSGESITCVFAPASRISGFAIRTGNQRSKDTFVQNCRPASLVMEATSGSGEVFTMTVNLEDTTDLQGCLFEQVVDMQTVKFTIGDVYDGTDYQDNCICELEFLTKEEGQGSEEGTDPAQADDGV